MNVQDILRTLAMVGADLPAYKALFDAAMKLFEPQTQASLKAAYAEAMARSDEAHRKAQED